MSLPTGRSFTRDTVHPFYIWVEGDEVLEYCVYCSATFGESHAVGPVQISKNRERPYQRCTNHTDNHACFLGTGVKPIDIPQAGLGMPRLPTLPDRGWLRGKKKCAQPDCNKQRGAKECPTGLCAGHCAELGASERMAGRDGTLLCTPHRPQIIKAIEQLNLPPPTISSSQFTELAESPTITSISLPTPSTSLPSSSVPVAHTSTQGTQPSKSSKPSKPTLSQATSRQLPRAMPMNVKFIRTDPTEQARTNKATQRAHREDVAALQEMQVRVVLWSKERAKSVITVSTSEGGAKAFAIKDHPDLAALVKRYGGDILEVYNVKEEEWVITSLATRWDLGGRNRFLIRDADLGPEDCEALDSELAQLLGSFSSHLRIAPTIAAATPRPRYPQGNTSANAPFTVAPYPAAVSSSTSLHTKRPMLNAAMNESTKPAILPAAQSTKRKATTQVGPVVTKVARTTHSGRVKIKGIEDFDMSTIPIQTAAKPRIIKNNPSDSFFCGLSFIDVARGLELIRYLHVVKGTEIADAFASAFSGATYKPTTFKRHRDAFFWADANIINEWKSNESSRSWKQFYHLRMKGKFESQVNGWAATDSEMRSLAEARAQARRKEVEELRAVLHHRYATSEAGDSDEEELTDNISEHGANDVGVEDSSKIGFEAVPTTYRDKQEDEQEEWELEEQMKPKDKGKGLAEPRSDAWKFMVKSIMVEDEPVIKQEKVESVRNEESDDSDVDVLYQIVDGVICLE